MLVGGRRVESNSQGPVKGSSGFKPGAVANLLALPYVGTPGQIRTDTVRGLSSTPLPIGLREHKLGAEGRSFTLLVACVEPRVSPRTLRINLVPVVGFEPTELSGLNRATLPFAHTGMLEDQMRFELTYPGLRVPYFPFKPLVR